MELSGLRVGTERLASSWDDPGTRMKLGPLAPKRTVVAGAKALGSNQLYPGPTPTEDFHVSEDLVGSLGVGLAPTAENPSAKAGGEHRLTLPKWEFVDCVQLQVVSAVKTGDSAIPVPIFRRISTEAGIIISA